MIDPLIQKGEYDRIANRLIDEGMLGCGLHEDLLLSSSKWFCQRIGRDRQCLADCFSAALENNVALMFALPSVSTDPDAVDDLFEFLHHLTTWVCRLPGTLLNKSPEPLVLVVGHRGPSDQFGAHIMRRGGPSIIFWQTFYTIRKTLGELNYARLSHHIGKTVIHEVIGHQLAFCSLAGPVVTREDVLEILDIAGIALVKLNDGSTLSARDFVRAPDLLAAVRSTEYIQSTRHPDRYYANVTELIAFAVEGVADQPSYDYEAIRRVLAGSLLREQQALNEGKEGTAIFRSYDLSTMPFACSYIYQDGCVWRETAALSSGDCLLCLIECDRLFRARQYTPTPPNQETTVGPGQSLDIRLPFDAMAVSVEGTSFLASPLGVYRLQVDGLVRQPEHWELAGCEIRWRADEPQHGILSVSNQTAEPMRADFKRLKAVMRIRETECVSYAQKEPVDGRNLANRNPRPLLLLHASRVDHPGE